MNSLLPFSYDLPEDRIAQRPVYPPESAKLLVYDKVTRQITNSSYDQILDYCRPDDIFIFNNSKVIPARFFGLLNGKEVELLLLRQETDSVWICLGRPLKKFQTDTIIEIPTQDPSRVIQAKVLQRTGPKEVRIRFNVKDEELFASGLMPIPPYIRSGRSDIKDITDYQSIFAKENGSVAAPTASLHFSDNLIAKMKDFGIRIKELTLHVGSASFLPLWNEDDEKNQDFSLLQKPGIELFKNDPALMSELLEAKKNGKRIIAVGTTVVRALESMAMLNANESTNTLNQTDLFISPGYDFKIITSLVTNFHQPRTTHLLLVSAFCSEESIKSIYNHALSHPSYRFLSYGDGMFIL